MEKLYSKDIKKMKDKNWWFTCYKKGGKLIYHIHCSDFRKYIYTEENGFTIGSRGMRDIPKSIQNEFLKIIKEEEQNG